MGRLRIIVVAYKIQEGIGSEDGTGWAFVRALLARGVDLTLVTRCNNAALLRGHPGFARATVIGVDVPKALSFYKRKGRGIIAYYYLWQILTGRLVNRLEREGRYDAVHMLNFHTDWAAHFLKPVRARLVWGPVVHHERVPAGFMAGCGWSDHVGEWARELVKRTFWLADPFLRSAVRRTDVIIYGNGNLAPPFRRASDKVRIAPYAGCGIPPAPMRTPRRFHLLSVGRLIALKGFDTALAAFAEFLSRHRGVEDIHLTIIGSGPLEGHIRRRIARLGLDGKVSLFGRMDQAALGNHYAASAAFLFPSFESQGLVVGEAMAFGNPVVCIEGTGPAWIAGDVALAVPRGSRADVVRGLADRLDELYAEFLDDGATGRFSARRAMALDRYREVLDWEHQVDRFLEDYRPAR